MVVPELEILIKIMITIIDGILAVFHMLCRDVISALDSIPISDVRKEGLESLTKLPGVL